jgi:hypothetical protein
MSQLGGDGALCRPRSVQRRNKRYDSRVIEHLFNPLNAGWDGAANHAYLTGWIFGIILGQLTISPPRA